MKHKEKLISVLIIIIYLISSIPYIIASNAGESGIVIDNQKMDINSLPNDIQDLLIYKKDSYNAILIEDPATDVSKLEGKSAKERKLILSKENQEIGSFVRIDDMTTDIYVTSYNLTNQPFEKLVIGDATEAELGSIMETINYYVESINSYASSTVLKLSIIISLSKIAFFGGGILVVLALNFLMRKIVALWNIPAIVTLYSFQSFLAIMLAFLNKLEVEKTSLLFSTLFILTLPLTLWMQRYEETEEGRQKIYGLYVKSNKILSKIKTKFGM